MSKLSRGWEGSYRGEITLILGVGKIKMIKMCDVYFCYWDLGTFRHLREVSIKVSRFRGDSRDTSQGLQINTKRGCQ